MTGLKKDNGRRTVSAEETARQRVVKQTVGQNRRVRRNNLRIDRQQRRADRRSRDGVVTLLTPEESASMDAARIAAEAARARDDLKIATVIGSEAFLRDATPEQAAAHRANEDRAAAEAAKALASQVAIVTKPGDPGGYRGEYDCGDCCSMTHCETHHKDEGTYPFETESLSEDAKRLGLTPDASLERPNQRGFSQHGAAAVLDAYANREST